MKLYKVDCFVYELSNSLLPARDPFPEEEAPAAEASFLPVGKAFIQALVNAGYTRPQAERVWYETFTYYWYVCGLRDIPACSSTCMWWLRKFLNPVIAQVDKGEAWHVPPAVIYFAVVMGIAVAVVLIVAPEWEKTYTWRPPCNLYLGVYEEQMWWMCLGGVTAKQRPFYIALAYQGGCIAAHTYEYIAPPVVTDRLHFWGTLDFRCWQIPWFRVYRAQYADCIFVGFLDHVAAHTYKLRKPFQDHWAPRGPMVVRAEDFCQVLSPCSA